MKCQAVHRALLGSEKCNRLPAEVVAHVRGCASCQVWQRRLVRLERNVAVLTVPPAPAGKAAFIRQFLAAPAATAAAPEEARRELAATAPVDSSTIIQVRKLDKLAAALRSTLHVPHKTLRSFPAPARRRIAAVLAASLLLVASVLLSVGPFGPFPKRPPDPLLAQVMKHDVRLASARSPRERIETLADLADDLQGVTRELFDAAGPEELKTLAGCYEKVVNVGIVEQAKRLPPAEQADVLKGIGQRLAAAGDEAERLEHVRPEASAAPLRTIKNAARQGAAKLPSPGGADKAMRKQAPVLFASVVFADFSGAPSTAARAKQLQRNVQLIETVVHNSLQLAGEQEPLKRAGACAEMADYLAGEIRRANSQNDSDRTLELAQHLRFLLKQGVAANLAAARTAIPNGSADETKLKEIQEGTATQMRELEQELPAGTDASDDVRLTRNTLREGRAEVEKAVKWVKAGN